ncbi:unnamed protein product [Effrenium voratum]|nr:unnamed protein product [Effrenium voratum]
MRWPLLLALAPAFLSPLRRTAVQRRATLNEALDIFGLEVVPSASELRRVFRKLAAKTHPDVTGSEEAFRRMVEAYRQLQSADPGAGKDKDAVDEFLQDWLSESVLGWGDFAQIERDTDDDGWAGRAPVLNNFVRRHDAASEGGVQECRRGSRGGRLRHFPPPAAHTGLRVGSRPGDCCAGELQQATMGFGDELASWTSDKAEPWRLERAKHLLMEVWTWVSAGCSGCVALQQLFCWLGLAVAIGPLAEQGARVKPVHSTVTTGLQRVGLSAVNHRAAAAAKAWTSALFLLDGTAEAWWWLKGIRSSQQAPRPWTDSKDGGVGVAKSVHNNPEDVWQQGEDPFDGNDPAAVGLEFDRDLDKEIDEVLRDAVRSVHTRRVLFVMRL